MHVESRIAWVIICNQDGALVCPRPFEASSLCDKGHYSKGVQIGILLVLFLQNIRKKNTSKCRDKKIIKPLITATAHSDFCIGI